MTRGNPPEGGRPGAGGGRPQPDERTILHDMSNLLMRVLSDCAQLRECLRDPEPRSRLASIERQLGEVVRMFRGLRTRLTGEGPGPANSGARNAVTTDAGVPPGGGQLRTVLFVEDEPGVRRASEKALRIRGFEVLSASSSEEALQLAAAHLEPIDLLIADADLHGTDGPSLAKTLSERCPGIEVLIVSGYAGHPTARGDGFAFLEKPFLPEELAARAERILSCRASGTSRRPWSPTEPSAGPEHPPSVSTVGNARGELLARVLIVEDEPCIRAMLRGVLEDEYEVLEAEDGVCALELLGEALPDVVLVDVVMPGVDGLTVCREVRRRAETEDVKVVVITGTVDEDLQARAFRAGADAVLGKPCSAFELRRQVKQLLHEASLERALREREALIDALAEAVETYRAKLSACRGGQTSREAREPAEES